MHPDVADRALPSAVVAALAAADAAGFTLSCSEPTGRLLATLAAARPDALVGESGTGFGVGTAWLASGLGPDGRLVTVEADPARAEAARQVHRDDPRVRVITGDWTMLADHGPFDLFFCDGGGKRTEPDAVIALVARGGLLVLDDFTPWAGWPPMFDGALDTLRLHYVDSPDLAATEVAMSPTEACIVAARVHT